MKKFTLLFIVCLSFSGWLPVQVIEDFEGPKYWFIRGDANDKSSFTLATNPDPSGINTNGTVLKFVRDSLLVARPFLGIPYPCYSITDRFSIFPYFIQTCTWSARGDKKKAIENMRLLRKNWLSYGTKFITISYDFQIYMPTLNQYQ